MTPVIALVGRPNTGKSTLFNRLTRSRDALVADMPGLTRDRQYGVANHGGKSFIVIDTGGISGADEGLDGETAGQAMVAVEEADMVWLLVDARDGLVGGDEQLVEHLRRRGKSFHLVVNKIDGMDADLALAEFHALGASVLHPVAAAHGRGVGRLVETALADFAVDSPGQAGDAGDAGEEEEHPGARVAVVGRPNVGKSTLVNRLLGEDRVVVSDQPGTTRDSIHVHYERGGVSYTLIDTAGVRRRGQVKEVVEKFSIVKTLKAIDDANVVILLADAAEGLVEQDLHLLGYVASAGRALVLAVNKWDSLESEDRERVRAGIARRLRFAEYVDVRFISALRGTGIDHLFRSVDRAYASATAKLPTHLLNSILEGAVAAHEPPLVNGRRIKLRYAHAGGRNPPRIVVHGNQVGRIPAAYRRYLENAFRRELGLSGTPVQMEFRTGDNPFAGRRNQLTGRQVARRRRLMRHVKKSGRGK